MHVDSKGKIQEVQKCGWKPRKTLFRHVFLNLCCLPYNEPWVSFKHVSETTDVTYSKSRTGVSEANHSADEFYAFRQTLLRPLIHKELFCSRCFSSSQLPVIPSDSNLIAHFWNNAQIKGASEQAWAMKKTAVWIHFFFLYIKQPKVKGTQGHCKAMHMEMKEQRVAPTCSAALEINTTAKYVASLTGLWKCAMQCCMQNNHFEIVP